jgi:hypothetical protein
MTTEYFSDSHNQVLDSNVWFDGQAEDWVTELWYEGDWVCIGRFPTKEAANTEVQIITIDEVNRLRALKPENSYYQKNQCTF